MKRTIKEFKTYEEQLQILKDKGLICDDSSLETLKRNNYYFLINRYKDCFIKPNTKPNIFKEGTTFNEIVALYHFDRDLRSVILKYIIAFENTLKSVISYEFSKKYGYNYLERESFTFSYQNCSNEILEKKIKNLFNSIKSTISQNKQTSRYLEYYTTNFEKIPLWVVINDLSLSLTIKFYKLLKVQDQEKIAKELNSTHDSLLKQLDIMSYFRNLAAHNQRLFSEKSQTEILHTKTHNRLHLNNHYNDLMALMITLKELLLVDESQALFSEIKSLIDKLDKDTSSITIDVIINKMGFEKFNEL